MDNRNYDGEISLKELILSIVRYWKSIVICTVTTMIIALVYLLGVAHPIYESTINGIINIPETVDSKYGTYTFPSTNKMDYINVITSFEVLSKTKEILGLESSIEGIRSQISVDSLKDSNGFVITTISDSPQNAQKLVLTLSKVLEDELSLRYKEHAIQVFLRDLDVKGKQLNESLTIQQTILEGLEENLSLTEPVLTLKKLITSNPTLATEIARQRGIAITDLSNEIMFEEYINPNYTELEAIVITTKNSINSLIVNINHNEQYIYELQAESEALQLYKTSGDASKMNKSMLDIIRSKISIQNSPSYSDTPISPQKMLTMLIAIFTGLTLGIIVAFFKNYWMTA